jgi:hypothetical protein
MAGKVRSLSTAKPLVKPDEHTALTKQEEHRHMLCTHLRELGIEAHPATIGEHIVITDAAAALILDIVDAAQARKTRMFRVTRRQPYAGTPGETDPAQRQGYYLEALTPQEAAAKLKKCRFASDKAGFTVQSWKDAGECSHGTVLGEFFGPESES